MIALMCVPFAIVCACARCVDAITSSGLERRAYPRRDRLLADRDMEEAGQLARAEALLHLLLEPADHEHLAEELAQALVGETRSLARYPFYLSHGRHYADRPMKLVDQWSAIEARLPRDWEDVRLTLATEEAGRLPSAAGMLGPLSAGRVDGVLAFQVTRAGGAAGPEAAQRLFGRLDEQRVWCRSPVARCARRNRPRSRRRRSVAQSWDDALATLPEDWTELLCQLEISGSDLLPRAALLCAPINPTRDRDSIGFVFRAGRVGYGVSTVMARRCFERLDEEGIAARFWSCGCFRTLSLSRHRARPGSLPAAFSE